MYDFSAVIFAGGASRRMGQNKALLPFGGYPTLAEFQYRRLEPLFKNVYISTKEPSLFQFTDNIIIDLEDEFASMVALLSMMKTLREEKFFVISVDTPLLSEKEIKRLIEFDEKSITVARTKNKTHPLFAIYHLDILLDLEKMVSEKEFKLRRLLEKSETHYVDFNDENLFTNLNYIDEYEQALKDYR